MSKKILLISMLFFLSVPILCKAAVPVRSEDVSHCMRALDSPEFKKAEDKAKFIEGVFKEKKVSFRNMTLCEKTGVFAGVINSGDARVLRFLFSGFSPDEQDAFLAENLTRNGKAIYADQWIVDLMKNGETSVSDFLLWSVTTYVNAMHPPLFIPWYVKIYS